MKIFPLKATLPLSIVSILGFTIPGQAQDSTLATKTSIKENSNYVSVKTFGGAKQYSKWSIGIAAGGFSPINALGGKNQYSSYNTELGYSGFIKYQLQHSFGLKLDFLGGQLSASNAASGLNSSYSAGFGDGNAVTTQLNYGISIKGEVDVAGINFLHRHDGLRLFVDGGFGLANFTPNTYGTSINTGFIPVGAGVKIRLSRALAFNAGYEAIFFDGNNILGNPYPNASAVQNKASYVSGGFELTFGTKRKPSLIWTNPVAVMYDELKANDSLAKEVDGLKTRVSAAEGDVSRLKKDSDGDGVSDVFDKCPNTPVGIKVDGAGCELPKMEVIVPDTMVAKPAEAPKDRVQFAFDSDQITPDSDPTLNRLASELKTTKEKLELDGFASSEGTEAYNLALSRRRAESVKKFLTRAGASSKHIKTKGYGDSRPIASNDTEEGRQKNRRVEFRINN